MRFGSTAKVLAKCKLKYYRISECAGGPEAAGHASQELSVWYELLLLLWLLPCHHPLVYGACPACRSPHDGGITNPTVAGTEKPKRWKQHSLIASNQSRGPAKLLTQSPQ